MTFSVTFSEDRSFTRTNIIRDPAFTYRNLYGYYTWQQIEDATGYWDFGTAVYGDCSWRSVPSTSTAGPLFVQTQVPFRYYPVSASTKYVFSVWVRADDDCTVQLYVDFWDGVTSSASWIDEAWVDTAVTGEEWTRLSFAFQTPAGTAGIGLYAAKLATATAVGLNTDGLLLEEITWTGDLADYEPDPFFDGDILPSYPPANATVSVAWDGTPGDSTSTLTYSSSEFTADLLSVDISQGRRSFQDFATPGTCELEILNPTTIPELDVLVQVFHGTTRIYVGSVRDTEVIYSMVEGTDVLRVSAESLMARAGRAELSRIARTSEDVEYMFLLACRAVDLAGWYELHWNNYVALNISYDAYQGTLLNYLQRIQTTVVGTMLDDKDYIILLQGDLPFYAQQGGGFTDVLPVTDEVVFSGIRFGSKAEEYVTKVRIEPNKDGLTPAERGDGYRSLVLESYSEDDAATEQLANTYLAAFTSVTPAPREVTIDVAAQSNTSWLDIIDLSQTGGRWPGGAWHQRQTVTFRGTTYPVVLQGYTLSATPDSARITFFMEPTTAYPYLRLDDTAVGVLNTNVLAP
jgi:hypothetical protein